jgi:signal transduction histidine kinase
MSQKEIPDSAIEIVAEHINSRSSKNYGINSVGNESNIETPQVFEILSFSEIDKSDRRFYAIDGSYNSEEFYNGLAIAIYGAGYICFQHGKQARMNSLDDPVILGQAYHPENILVTNEDHLNAIYDELLTLKPVKRLMEFWNEKPEECFSYDKKAICTNLSTLLSFCQEVLEIALILEAAELPETKAGDFILRDGTLRPNQIKQLYMVRLGKFLHEKGIFIVAITKQSPVKMELSYTFKQIDGYERYLRKREETEHYFRREILYRLETERESKDGVKRVDHALRRLKEFLYLDEAYFLVNDIEKLNRYQIFGKATSSTLNTDEESFSIILDTDKLAIRDRISVFELSGKEKYSPVLASMQQQLPNVPFKHVYMGTCPLKGATNGFWVFVNPQAKPGLRATSELTRYDKNFLARFCASARDVLNTSFATSIVMRKISHELGSSLWRLYDREAQIAKGELKIEDVRIAATRNLQELRRYQSLLDNLKSVFMRRTKATYDFLSQHINPIILAIVESFEGDPDMEKRCVTIEPPELTPNDIFTVDAQFLTMAIYNMIENAVKYSFSNRHVSIFSKCVKYQDEHKYQLDIVNFGVGILPEEIEQRLIFYEDYRGLLSRDRHRTGSGLGLALADAIVRNHSGSITVKSISARDLSLRKSEFAGVVRDPSVYLNPKGDLLEGFLNRFTVTLPNKHSQSL